KGRPAGGADIPAISLPRGNQQDTRTGAPRQLRTGFQVVLLSLERSPGPAYIAIGRQRSTDEATGCRSNADDRRSEVLALHGRVFVPVAEPGQVPGPGTRSQTVSQTDSVRAYATAAGTGRVCRVPDPQQPTRAQPDRLRLCGGQ